MKALRIVILLLIVCSCNGKQAGQETDTLSRERTFQMVTVPSIITEPAERAEYLVKHYWDHFDFADTAYIGLPEVTEQALSDYIGMLPYVSAGQMSASIKGMMAKAEADSAMFAHFSDLYEKYLYDPNSPLRNEEYYIAVLEAIMTSSKLDEIQKVRPAHLLQLALQNRLGTKALDFTYTLATGRTGTLYNVKSDYLLLFFYNPDCEACKNITAQLDGSLLVNELIRQSKLKVLAVYPDEDLSAWKAHVSVMPKSWINAYDAQIALKNEEIYDLKAIPALYLLDKDKNVLLKDATYQQIEDYLGTQFK